MKAKFITLTPLFFGLALLIYTWKPIVEWNFFIKPALRQKSITFLSPLAEYPKEKAATQSDFLQPNLNFEKKIFTDSQIKTFFLTIEKLGIKKAKVVTGEDFLTNLAHLPTSATPGQVGNVFISGHSVLPQFFSPGNYWSIFSKLYQLEADDRLVLEDGDKIYVYKVSEMLVVEPEDTWVIKPPDLFGSYLTLLTCGVGGIPSERIVVRATLQNSQKIT